MNSKIKYVFSSAMILLLIIIDQLTKYLAYRFLDGNPDISLLNDMINITYLKNTGAAFSMFENKMAFFYIITVLLLAVYVYFLIKVPYESKYKPILYTVNFLAAGAIGNFIDRLIHRYVIDFIYFKFINFPVFNVADIYVTCSVFVLFILLLFVYRDEHDFDFLKRKR